MRSYLPALAVVFLASFAAPPAHATDDPDRIVFGAGLYHVTDTDSHQRYNDIRFELHLNSIPIWRTHPWLGVEATKHNTHWIGAGLESDIDLYSDWLVLTLQTGVGYFDDGNFPWPSDYINPPSGIEFRHQAELAVRFPAGNRVGIGFSHMSNAGIKSSNPSMSSLMVNFHIPINLGLNGKSHPVD